MECCLTNRFPLVKPGGMGTSIKRRDLIDCGQTFTLKESPSWYQSRSSALVWIHSWHFDLLRITPGDGK